MCQMYAIFEEVIGPQPPVTYSSSKGPQHHPEEGDKGIVTSSNQATNPEPENNNSSQYGSSKPKKPHQRIYGSPASYQPIRYSSTLPRSGRRRLYSSSTSDSIDLDDTASISSSNPLLDTISVLTYDPPDDSDDYYYDLNGSEYDQCKSGGEKTRKSSSGVPEVDRDSIGYAGSSSIDSGYKSFCPTPEIPDPSVYGTEAGRQGNPYYSDSSNAASQNRNGKPRIMMGTKVISRQGHVSPLRESPAGSRRSDSSLYDVNLDHLMYLRQSLLSAIQKCESSNKSNPTADPSADQTRTGESNSSYNPVNDERYLDSCGTKPVNTNYTKTVRFNTDVKVSTVNTTQPACQGSDLNVNRTVDAPAEHQKVQSKSILKDPLCANLRSQLEAGSVDCTLEEEIDSLLYGRAEFYDLESVDDFPCSYVTMIEEKYRSGKPSIAKVRKLKGEKNQDHSSKPSPPSENHPEPPNTTPESDSRLNSKDPNSKDPPPTVSISKTAKCRFTEVARCMLEIIEDLQLKKLQPDSNKDPVEATAESSKPPPTANQEEKPPTIEAAESSKSNDTYASAAEYHVYEEIDYDFLSVNILPSKPQEVPPPLPARPSGMVIRPEIRKRVPSPPPRKSLCPQKRTLTATEVRNRPKQRGNLYCLFSDRVERRNISRSLEREWRDNGCPDNQEDDYGFKKEFPSI